MTDSQSETAMAVTTRRTVLMGASAAGAAALLAACGTDDGDSVADGDTDTTDQGGPVEPTDTAGPTGSGETAEPSEGGDSGGEQLAKTSDIPVGGGKVFKDKQVVVTQPAKGTFKGFSSVCTHQGCAVGPVADNVIVCKCHNSEFSAEDGSVKGGPAGSPLSEMKITVDGDAILLG